VNTLIDAGYSAVAPMLSTRWSRETSKKYRIASNWSERHATYVSGLGTFGLCDGLITSKGKAMRTGSVIAKIRIKPTMREYEDHNAYCLYYSNNTCLECVRKCPVGAISKLGHDKDACSRFVRSTREYVKKSFNFEGYGCGLCQTGVACESWIPRKHPARVQ
jgi:epoxyqueuosine reductase QueG